MLNALRRNASSWIVRVLLLLLIASFALWGIGSEYFGRGGIDKIADVGRFEVSARKINADFENRLGQFRQAFGGALTQEQAIAFGMLEQSLQAEISARLLDNHARTLNLGVSDQSVRDVVAASFGAGGTIDRQSLDIYLRTIGLSEDEFLEQLRFEIGRQRLINAMASQTSPPEILVSRLVEYQNQERDGTFLLIEAEKISVEEPSDEEIAQFLADNQANYRAPERRDLSIVYFDASAIEEEVSVSDDEIRERYEEQLAAYRSPEQRSFEQYLTSDENVANELLDALNNAAEGERGALLEQFDGQGVTHSTFDLTPKSDLPREIADDIFKASDTGIAQSAFGFHVFAIKEIVEESVESLESKKAEIEKTIRREKAQAGLPDYAAEFDDLIAAGDALEAAASAFNFELHEFEGSDRSGMNASGELLIDLPLANEDFNKMFAGAEDETSLLEETNDGAYYMFRVNGIEAPRDLTLEEAADDLKTAWMQEQSDNAAADFANQLIEDVENGQTFEELADTHSDVLNLIVLEKIRRQDQALEEGLSPEVVEALFSTPEGETAAEPVLVSGGATLVRTDGIHQPEIENLDSIAEQLEQTFQDDIITQYQTRLSQIYSVDINDGAFAALKRSYLNEDASSLGGTLP